MFQLVVEGKWVYLLGISGDNIAYVTQASDSLTITYNKVPVEAAISAENFRHTVEVLYIDINESDRKHCFRLTSNQSKWRVDVKFALKDSYFDSLQRFVASLTQATIQRVLPCNFPHFQPASLHEYHDLLNLQTCSEDQRNALATIVTSPANGPPVLVTGPFGTGKTRILALAAHYFLQCSTKQERKTSILVCTQQHASADAFIECLVNLVISIPEKSYIARVKYQPKQGHRGSHSDSAMQRYERSHFEFKSDFSRRPPTNMHPYLIVTTCQAAHGLKKVLPSGFYFTHILLDEVAQMREAEAIAPLCLANNSTKIVIAGDKHQVRFILKCCYRYFMHILTLKTCSGVCHYSCTRGLYTDLYLLPRCN